MESVPEILSIIGTIVLMLAVFAAAYLVSKYLGKRYKAAGGPSKHLTVVESTVVGKDRSILIVKAGDKMFLVGSTPNGITLLSELDAAQFASEEKSVGPEQKDFLSTFKDVVRSRLK